MLLPTFNLGWNGGDKEIYWIANIIAGAYCNDHFINVFNNIYADSWLF